MGDQVMKTSVDKIACEKKNCDKSYVNKGSLKTHMRKHHQTELIASPLGDFPPWSSSQILQDLLYREIVVEI